MPGSQCAPRKDAERSEPTIRVLGFPTKPRKPSQLCRQNALTVPGADSALACGTGRSLLLPTCQILTCCPQSPVSTHLPTPPRQAQ